jgi:DNA-binding transcriptional LysR family regulator
MDREARLMNRSLACGGSDLQLFLEVASVRSFNKAGQRLNASHPTMARAVRRLERQLGTQLVFASELGVKLTPAGERLARKVSAIDGELARAFTSLRR